MKRWQTVFEIKRTLQHESPSHRSYSWAIFYKGQDKRPNSRFYSNIKDAKRGAAQILNAIEKSLLGGS